MCTTSARKRRERFITYLGQRLRDKRLDGLVKNLFRPSYGGNRTDDLTIAFDYDGEVTADDARASLDKVAAKYGRALEAVERVTAAGRADAQRLFAANIQKAFYGFEPDFFQQNLLGIVDDVVSVIKGSIERWPTLLEIGYFEKRRRGLPQTCVKNRKK